MRKLVCTLALLLPLSLVACEPGSIAPSLEAVVGAIDARRAMACADELTKHGAKAAATCLGVSVANDAITFALKKAAELAEQAREAMGPTGADDMTDEMRSELAGDLDSALGELSKACAAVG